MTICFLDQRQEAKIAATAKELKEEEKQRADVKSAAAKLLAEAQKQEKAEALRRKIKQAKDEAQLNFEKIKQQALRQAQEKIAAAKEEEEKKVKQELGANDDDFLNMNPPGQPTDPYSNLDPPIAQEAEDKKDQKLGANGDDFIDMGHQQPSQEDDFGNLDPPGSPPAPKDAKKDQKLGANGDDFIDMGHQQPSQEDDFGNLDPPGSPPAPKDAPSLKGVASAKAADAQVASLEKELAAAKKKASGAEKALMQHLKGFDVAAPGYDESDPDSYHPVFNEAWKKGDLGPLADSKRVPEDHPVGHKRCRLHDIDCDEMWPYGKPQNLATEPEERMGPLGDNMVGVFGQDDVVVNTEKSGLKAKAEPYEDKMGHLEEDSKENKDLLYGNGRKSLSQRYLGVGDVYVPLKKVQQMEQNPAGGGQPLADFMFGSWEQGFHKPHRKAIRGHVNMFDQPYRQAWNVAKGNGHAVFKTPPTPNAYGGPVSLGPSHGDDKEDDTYVWDDKEEEETQANAEGAQPDVEEH